MGWWCSSLVCFVSKDEDTRAPSLLSFGGEALLIVMCLRSNNQKYQCEASTILLVVGFDAPSSLCAASFCWAVAKKMRFKHQARSPWVIMFSLPWGVVFDLSREWRSSPSPCGWRCVVLLLFFKKKMMRIRHPFWVVVLSRFVFSFSETSRRISAKPPRFYLGGKRSVIRTKPDAAWEMVGSEQPQVVSVITMVDWGGRWAQRKALPLRWHGTGVVRHWVLHVVSL